MTAVDDMRSGDAERDAVMTALHEHFAAGRLDREELEERLGTTLTAKTRGALRTIVKDLPGPNGLPGPERPVPGHWTHGHALAYAHGHGHPARGPHHGPFPAFPLMLGVFVFVTFAVGVGAAMLAVLHIAMLVWIVRAVALAVGVRRARAGKPG